MIVFRTNVEGKSSKEAWVSNRVPVCGSEPGGALFSSTWLTSITRRLVFGTHIMSYYNPGPPGAYQYGYPPAQYPGYTSGAYQYPTTAGYGSWPYYYPQQHQQQPQATQQRPTVARTSSSTPARTSTSFATTHTPASYAARDTVNAASGGGGARASAGGKKQANLRGLFTKECASVAVPTHPAPSYVRAQ